MSFSGQIKEELEKINSSARHCHIAELAALYKFCHKETKEKSGVIVLTSENELAIQKCFTLIKKTFNIYKEFSWQDVKHVNKSVFSFEIDDLSICDAIDNLSMGATLTQNACCKRAYIRGAFLAIGSISDPQKSYHLEFVCQNVDDCVYIQNLLAAFDVDAKIIQRKKYQVLYVKDGAQIVDTLNIMGAHLALMEFENTRIIKEVRNSVNRKFNCEMANIGKTVSAAQKQIDDIKMLKQSEKYRTLPQSLKEIAEARLENPEASLKELGELFDPPIGKSGINHRLRKLSEIAAVIKEENYD